MIDIDLPTILLSQIHDYPARSHAYIVCSECGTSVRCKVASLRIYSKEHGGRDVYTCKVCTSKKNWQSEEKREEARKITEKAYQDGAYKDVARKATERYSNPEERQKTSEAVKKAYQKDEQYAISVGEAARERMQNPEYREKQAIIRSIRPRNISKLQLQFYGYLDDLGVVYHKESLETRVGFYSFDCKIPTELGTPDLLIEVQGIYPHNRPEQVIRDRQKFSYIDNNFSGIYEIMYVWEHELATKDRVLDRLKLKLGLEIETVDFNFSDIQICEAPAADYRSFLDAYHYIGKDRGGVCYGAYLNDKLIACCVFSPPVRQNLSDKFGEFVELSRFCIHPSYHKKNFATWFISKCIKLSAATTVVSYADTTVGHQGTIYKAANFEFSHEVPPDYWYLDQDGYVMKKKTLYQKAKLHTLTEAEFAEKFGYTKKWGGKKLCYIYNKK